MLFQNEGRGLKDPEGVKRKKRRQQEAERKALNHGQGGGGGLKVIIAAKEIAMFYVTELPIMYTKPSEQH